MLGTTLQHCLNTSRSLPELNYKFHNCSNYFKYAWILYFFNFGSGLGASIVDVRQNGSSWLGNHSGRGFTQILSSDNRTREELRFFGHRRRIGHFVCRTWFSQNVGLLHSLLSVRAGVGGILTGTVSISIAETGWEVWERYGQLRGAQSVLRRIPVTWYKKGKIICCLFFARSGDGNVLSNDLATQSAPH